MGLAYKLLQIKRMMLFARRSGVSFSNLQGRRGMVFIKTSGVLAGYWLGISIVGDLTCQNM